MGIPKAGAFATAAGVACIALGACGQKQAGGMPPLPVEVKAVTVEPSSTVTYADKVGEVRGSQEVDLRARVGGILLQTHFDDGALVEKGQLLFSIDAREFRAQVASAEARVAAAEANFYRARQDVARYEPLLADEAISRQVYDNAVAAARQAKAEVDASRAALQEAQLGLDYAEVRAPLHGRIGVAQVFPGGLVTAGQTVLATLSSDDPAWVYFTISEAELLEYERQNDGRAIQADDPRLQVRLVLSDGSMYPLPGRINFGDRALDPTTGTYRLRAEFPNPGHKLLPGLFARVRATGRELRDALIVPDRAVQEQLGRYFLTVVGPGDKAELRPVTLGPRFGNRQVITSGLQPGDRVVAEGIQKARPGAQLKVVPVTLEDFDRPAATAGADAATAAGNR
ncbi:MAG TPA: efflux RND transporter periplasmic adaptor subunit [Steroidobacteraceae bacterium]|nr:efflux RND transporter periplasmic adaptor subunit [Steroidobacteraceae bacterium]